MITKELAESLLEYDQLTGIFTWKHRDKKHFKNEWSYLQWNKRYSGKVAGSKKNDSGYVVISIKKTLIRAHRLAWLIMRNEMPKSEIDHINGQRDDNSFSNLRSVSKEENTKNRRLSKNNKTGYHGITRHSNGKFRAKSYVNDTQVHLGYFQCLQDAVIARKEFEANHGFHKNHGRPA